MSKPAPSARERVQDREVGVRLHRVADEVVDAREALVEFAERRLDQRARIDVAGVPKRRATPRGDAVERERAADRARGRSLARRRPAAGGLGKLERALLAARGESASASGEARRGRVSSGIMNETDFHRPSTRCSRASRRRRGRRASTSTSRRHPHRHLPRRLARDRQPPDAQPRDLGRGALRRLPLRACSDGAWRDTRSARSSSRRSRASRVASGRQVAWK
jgi:hypothetical protein